MSSETSDLATHDAFDDEAEGPAAGDRSRMSFLEHLDELRRRILYSLYAVLARLRGLVLLPRPLCTRYMMAYFGRFGGKLIFTGLTDGVHARA